MKKRSTRIITLSTALVALALSASIGCAAEDNIIMPLDDGSDFDITGRASSADVSGNTTNLSSLNKK
ncbi:hypothetical protein [Brevibacillus agri]|uniref:hypothetical protein n=1 Tax=Brevibacillus agri TaxID=51101 RepID=UPI0012FE63F1|nr:hypothetical protein [Brevibacillus agri]